MYNVRSIFECYAGGCRSSPSSVICIDVESAVESAFFSTPAFRFFRVFSILLSYSFSAVSEEQLLVTTQCLHRLLKALHIVGDDGKRNQISRYLRLPLGVLSGSE